MAVSDPVSHDQHEADVNQSENRKSIAERTMHHMPEIEDLFSTAQEQNVLGERSLFPSNADSAL